MRSSRRRAKSLIAIFLVTLALMQMVSLPVTSRTSSWQNDSKPTVYTSPDAPPISKPSIDAIAAWAKIGSQNSEIWYSMYGHEPTIPARNETLSWKWWNGTDPNVVASPLSTQGKNSHPDAAFGRNGEIIVAWSHIGGVSGPFTIMFARWNSDAHNRSIGILAAHNLSSPKILRGLESPTVAIDVNGKAIAVWGAYWDYSSGSEAYFGRDLYYSVWNGTGWSVPVCLYDAPRELSKEYYVFEPEIAFTRYESDVASPLTRHKAILVWKYDYRDFTTTPDYLREIRCAMWNGSSFTLGTIPGSQTNYTIVPAELSSDKLGNTQAIWSRVEPTASYTYSSKWNGTAWATTLVCVHADVVSRVAVAFTQNNSGIMAHDAAAGDIYYNLGVDGNWSTCINLAEGNYPSIACLPHNLTLACWIGTEVDFSVFNGTSPSSPTGIPGTAGDILREVTVAAKTGSPALPLAEWSFFAYQQGYNDLENDIARNDLNEMKAIGSTALINVVTLTARHSTKTSNLYYVRRNAVAVRTADGWVPADLNLADGETLGKFIKWVIEEYPAEHYSLVLEDHGSGYRGSMSKRELIHGAWRTVDRLTLDELESALRNSGLQSRKLDVIGFDACLMAMLEVAFVAKSYAEYLIASELLIPGNGWSYNLILSRLVSDPLMSRQKLVETITDHYGQYYDDKASGFPETLAVINLSRVVNLVNAVEAFAAVQLANLNTYETETVHARLNTQEVLTDKPQDSYPEYVDLYSYANQIYGRVNNESIRGCSLDIMTNINATVIRDWHDSSPQAAEAWVQSDYHGLTIYFEKVEPAYDQSYNSTKLAINTSWDEFVRAYLTHAVRWTSIMLVRLQSILPLNLHIYDSHGNHVGYNASLKPSIEVGLTNASYVELDNNTVLAYFPIEVSTFTWVVDAGILTEEENRTSYTLIVRVINQGETVSEETYSGTILCNATISGVFPSAGAGIPVALLLGVGIAGASVGALTFLIQKRRKRKG